MNLIPDIEFHHASDRRCYYGAYSSDLQKEVDCKEEANKILAKNNLNITYFPAGGYYIGFKTYKGKAPDIITDDCYSFELCYSKIQEYCKSESQS